MVFFGAGAALNKRARRRSASAGQTRRCRRANFSRTECHLLPPLVVVEQLGEAFFRVTWEEPEEKGMAKAQEKLADRGEKLTKICHTSASRSSRSSRATFFCLGRLRSGLGRRSASISSKRGLWRPSAFFLLFFSRPMVPNRISDQRGLSQTEIRLRLSPVGAGVTDK